MESGKIYNAVIVGTGRVAGLLEFDKLRDHPCTHCGIYQNHPGFRIKAVSSPEKNNAENFADKFGIEKVYKSYKKMIDKEKPDILSICTPCASRFDILIYAIKKNIPVILTEKPLALSIKEHEIIIKMISKKDTLLFVNHLRRFSWDWREVKKIITKQIIGKIQFSKASFTGGLLHSGTHMFDMVNYLFGSPKYINGEIFTDNEKKNSKFKNKIEDGGVRGTMHFADNHILYVDGEKKDYFQFELEINGTLGRIRIGNQLNELWIKTECDYAVGFSQIKRSSFPNPPLRYNPWLLLLDEVYLALNEKRSKRNMAQDSLKAFEMALAFALSSKKDKPIKLPIKKNKTVKIKAY